jgi:hypothetical protein
MVTLSSAVSAEWLQMGRIFARNKYEQNQSFKPYRLYLSATVKILLSLGEYIDVHV